MNTGQAWICEECGGRSWERPQKIEGKKAWCSVGCLRKAGKLPRPEPKAFTRKYTVPRMPKFKGEVTL